MKKSETVFAKYVSLTMFVPSDSSTFWASGGADAELVGSRVLRLPELDVDRGRRRGVLPALLRGRDGGALAAARGPSGGVRLGSGADRRGAADKICCR